MSDHQALKRAARAYAKEHGVNYTTALRALQSGPAAQGECRTPKLVDLGGFPTGLLDPFALVAASMQEPAGTAWADVVPTLGQDAQEGWNTPVLGRDPDTGQDVTFDLADPTNRVTYVTGPPGVGKTILASRLAQHAGQHAAGVIFCSPFSRPVLPGKDTRVVADPAQVLGVLRAVNQHTERQVDVAEPTNPVLIVVDEAIQYLGREWEGQQNPEPLVPRWTHELRNELSTFAHGKEGSSSVCVVVVSYPDGWLPDAPEATRISLGRSGHQVTSWSAYSSHAVGSVTVHGQDGRGFHPRMLGSDDEGLIPPLPALPEPQA